MYCPNCAAPVDGMKFCRQCGANVSLVPQALTGQLPVAPAPPQVPPPFVHGRRRWSKQNRPATMDGAVREFFSGAGFLFVALAIWQFFPGGFAWWFWLLIPAFGAMGKGLGQYFAVREQQQQLSASAPQFRVPVAVPPAVPVAPPQPQFSVPTTSELKLPANVTPPVSITEHTTALLDRERAKPKDQA